MDLGGTQRNALHVIGRARREIYRPRSVIDIVGGADDRVALANAEIESLKRRVPAFKVIDLPVTGGTLSLHPNQSVTIDVVANDTDVDNNNLTVTEVAGQAIAAGETIAVANGQVTLNDDGTLTFTPAANYNGPASFDYTVSDGDLTDTGTVDIDVTAVNDAPVANTPLANRTNSDGESVNANTAGAFTDGLAPEVAALFEAETARLKEMGHELVPVDMSAIGAAVGLNKIIVAVEALRIYGDDLDRLEEVGDPRVLTRIRFAETLSDAEIAEAYDKRAAVVAQFNAAMAGLDALVAPTLMRLPPSINEVEAEFDRLNMEMLRNTSLVNLVDGCALAMPTPRLTPAFSMTMLVGVKGADAALFAIAERLTA